MALFCDVALPVPLYRTFTYAVGTGPEPAVGARVLVPFSGQRLTGVVLRLHDEALPEGVRAKPVQAVLDEEAPLPAELMELANWIAAYYLAPLGEVLRGMLPLGAEVRRQWVYRIAEAGRKALYEGAAKGASRRSRLPAEEQDREYAVLNYLEAGDTAKTAALRSATGAGKSLLDGMVRKRWLLREAVAQERDARRLEQVAILVDGPGTEIREQRSEPGEHGIPTPALRLPRLNANQLAAMAEMSAAAGGRIGLRDLRDRLARRNVPASTIATLVRRRLVRLEDEESPFAVSGLTTDGKLSAHQHLLNEAQTEALATIAAALERRDFRPYLLYGVTGSGKTAVYVAVMQRALRAGKNALLLVPEIGLTPAMAGEMFQAFGPEVALLHSGLTPGERAGQWHRIRKGEARVVVGTRSAVFAPLPELGLLIVDEEQDSSYKQEETPRYHGRDVAVMRAKLNGAVVVLGSATPSIESWSNTERGRYGRIEMLARVRDRPLPDMELVDMRAEFQAVGKEEIFSRRLVAEVAETLDRGEQAIILLNRRGYSFVVMCRSCGARIECENCAIAMTYHKSVEGSDVVARPGQRLECHYCGFRRPVPAICESCGSEHLYFLGAGSQQGEERLRAIFPGARIGRMDRDSVRGRGEIERVLGRLHTGEINLLVGTQMIAKGHDIHGVTTVGVVGADFALGLPDFRAAERVFQLLTQVSGRAGRGDKPGRVLVQTYHPEHYAIRFAQTHDYPGFVAKEMEYRRWMHYPPFTVLANVIVQSEDGSEAMGWAGQIGQWFEGQRINQVRVIGPAAAPISRLKRIYRYHFVLKAEQRSVLGDLLRGLLRFAENTEIPRRAVVVDVDPVHLM